MKRRFLILISFSLITTFIYYRTGISIDQINNHILNHENKIASCLNDAYAINKYAMIVLLDPEDPNYVISTLKLGKSANMNMKNIKYDKIVIEIAEKPLNQTQRDALTRSGWDFFCVANRLPIPGNLKNQANKRFQEVFLKFIAFNMTEYESVLVIDGDALILGDLDELFSFHTRIDYNKYYIGLTKDTDIHGKRLESYNSGVFLVKPNATEYKRVIMLMNDTSKFKFNLPEQNFLNYWYKDKIFDFGFKYNTIIWFFQKYNWNINEYKEDIKILHFTYRKPWECLEKARKLCQIWLDAPI